MYRRRMKMAASDLASSDMMSLETRQRVWQARLDPRRQTLPSASTLLYEIAGPFLCAAQRAQRAASRRRHQRRAASVGSRHHAAGGRYARLHRFWNGPPVHMRRGRPVVFASKSSSGDGVFRCVGTSRSRVGARAPIVTELRNIGQLTEGEILVTQSTDPGRTPVFNLLKGIVLETGGMLAHGSRPAPGAGVWIHSRAVPECDATHSRPGLNHDRCRRWGIYD
jgi:hypothetical protein